MISKATVSSNRRNWWPNEPIRYQKIPVIWVTLAWQLSFDHLSLCPSAPSVKENIINQVKGFQWNCENIQTFCEISPVQTSYMLCVTWQWYSIWELLGCITAEPSSSLHVLHSVHNRWGEATNAVGWQKTAICQLQIICPAAKKPREFQDPGHRPASLSSVLLLPYFISLIVFTTLKLFIYLPLNCVFSPLGKW